jgi:hypothetical protein
VGEPDRYASAWSELITWRRWAGGLFLGWVPVNVLAMFVLAVSCSSKTADRAFLWVAFLTMLPFVIAAFRLSAVKCPRCGKSFTSGLAFRNPLASRCVHCKLPEGSRDPSRSSVH